MVGGPYGEIPADSHDPFERMSNQFSSFISLLGVFGAGILTVAAAVYAVGPACIPRPRTPPAPKDTDSVTASMSVPDTPRSADIGTSTGSDMKNTTINAASFTSASTNCTTDEEVGFTARAGSSNVAPYTISEESQTEIDTEREDS